MERGMWPMFGQTVRQKLWSHVGIRLHCTIFGKRLDQREGLTGGLDWLHIRPYLSRFALIKPNNCRASILHQRELETAAVSFHRVAARRLQGGCKGKSPGVRRESVYHISCGAANEGSLPDRPAFLFQR